ncbi:TraB/GumN family protein [Cesiribacter andamanensis]|uniref:Erythromycin esterase n=1 Tax=Cesiribacter andamanensis AMV16 TaxID=1279009 RepID=M7N0Z7_9BACT|nr:erythromycin esterase family protein [Cesiribacter andamanensis]EMR00881.1 Erythromycin esterase [Cesiribacter andamanensis AMV16]
MRLLCLLLLLAGPLGYSQTLPQSQAYLQANQATWNGRFSGLQRVFDKELYRQQVLLIGETHGIQYSYELQFALIAHLKKKINFTYLLLEVGYLDGLLLNRYLSTGDETYLEAFFRGHQGSFHWNKSTERLYRNLYELNRQLPEEERLILLPLDLEFSHRESLAWLQQELFVRGRTGRGERGSFEEALYAIDPLQEAGSELLHKFGLAWERFVAQEPLMRRQLGSRYAETAYLLRNLHQRYQLQQQGSMEQKRDSLMYENLLFWKEQLGIGNQQMVGLFGSEHVKQQQPPGKSRLAAILKASPEIQGVVSFFSVYTNCEIMLPNRMATEDTGMPVYLTRKLENDGSMSEATAGLELLPKLREGTKAALYRLDARNSPFGQSAAFLKLSEQEQVTTDMFQILILIRDSPATIPYGGLSSGLQ